jgi:hypothetical protein
MKSCLIFACLLILSFPVIALEKSPQGIYSILATEIDEPERAINIYLTPVEGIEADLFSLDFEFNNNQQLAKFSIGKDDLLFEKIISSQITVKDISGAAFSLDGPTLMVSYRLSHSPELWNNLIKEKQGYLKFRYLVDANVYLERRYLRFEQPNSLVELPPSVLNYVNTQNKKTIKLPISFVLAGPHFQINNQKMTDLLIKNLKTEVDRYWKTQCKIELEFKSIRVINSLDKASYSFIADLVPEYFIMESWFHRREKSIPVVSGITAYGALGVSMMQNFWTVKNVKGMMAKTQNLDMVFFSQEGAAQEDGHTLAHELGHVLLQTGHSDEPNNLMQAGKGISTSGPGPRRSKITKAQCETARTYLMHLSSQLDISQK